MWYVAAWCGGFVMGIMSAQYVAIEAAVAWLMAGVVLTIIALRNPLCVTILLVVVGGMFIGMWRGSAEQVATNVFDEARGKTIVVDGSVAEDVTTNKRGQQVVRLGSLSSQGRRYPGVLYVTTAKARDVRRSDTMTVRGTLSEGFGSFVGSMYTVTVVSHQRVAARDIGVEVRDNFASRVRQFIDEPMASLGLGYLVGQKRDLTPQLEQSLRIAGLTHIVVASGYNLTILVRFARRLCARYSRYLATMVPLGLVAGFVGVTGMSPSMSRAGLVSVLGIAAWYVGRRFHPVVLIAIAAAVTAGINPFYVWGDLGWWLSFTAFVGVMVIAPVLQGYFFGDTPPGTIRQLLGETIAAQLATLPVIIGIFGVVSVVALAANAMIVPFVPLAMGLVFATGICGYVAPWLAIVIATPTEWLLGAMISVAQWWSAREWAQLDVTLPLGGVIALYLVLGAAVWYLQRAGRVRLAEQSVVE